MNIYGMTDKGMMRKNNEDSFFLTLGSVGVFDSLMVVCDGMGGHRLGEVASSAAVHAVVNSIESEPDMNPAYVMEQAVSIANLEVRKSSEEHRSFGMGTTLVACGIQGKTAYVANVGDSRLYLINQNEQSILQVTHDHSYVEEQVARGLLERGSDEYNRKKNVITRAVGVYSEVEADQFEIDLAEGDYILLCSDGLTNMVGDEEIREIVLDESRTVEERVRALVDAANGYGGSDNITVVLYDTEEVFE